MQLSSQHKFLDDCSSVLLLVGLELLHTLLGGQGDGDLVALGLGQHGVAHLNGLGDGLQADELEAALLNRLLALNTGQLFTRQTL